MTYFSYKDLTNLESINLNQNRLQRLDRDTFKYNLKLKNILLWKNELTALYPQMFSHLPNLKWVELGGNVCIDKDFGDSPSKADIERDLSTCGMNYVFQDNIQDFDARLNKVEENTKDIAEISRNVDRMLEILSKK